MRTLLLSLMFLVGVSFTGIQTTATASSGCTNCWDYANGAEAAGGNWQDFYDDCLTNLSPCAISLDPVIIKR